MSTSREEFVIVGVDVSEFEDDEFFDKYEEYYSKDKKGDFTLLIDGYSGNYTLFGEVIEHGDEFEGLQLTELDLDQFNEAIYRVRQKVKELFGVEKQPRVYALTHWS